LGDIFQISKSVVHIQNWKYTTFISKLLLSS